MHVAKVALRYDSEELDLAGDRLRENLLPVFHQGFTLEPTCSAFLKEGMLYSFVIVPERSTIQRIMASELLQESAWYKLPMEFELLGPAVGMPELFDCTVVSFCCRIVEKAEPFSIPVGKTTRTCILFQ